jgi:hypothetical protein
MILVGIAIVYALIINPNVQSINNMDWTSQFAITIGLLFVVAWLVGAHINGSMKRLVGLLCIFLAVDLFVPPLLVSTDGTLAQADVIGGCMDTMMYQLWSHLGISGELLWYFVYPISFVIFMGAGLFLLSRKGFQSALRQSII